MSLVIDASVAVKWAIAEEGSAPARALLAAGRPPIAPDLVVAEVASVVGREIRRGTFLARDMDLALATVGNAFVRLEPTPPLVRDALSIAVEVNRAVYDCLYLALAERTGHPLLTADATFARKLNGGRWLGLVQILGAQEAAP